MPDSFQLDRLAVVLVATRNQLNIGAAARAMSNFGFSCLRLVRPYEPSYREARSAVGAAQLLASADQFPSVAEAVADCSMVVGTTAARHRELQQPLHRLEPGARLIRRDMTRGRVALLFGSEKTGLTAGDLSHCHWLLRIPTHEQNVSMNLGQAVAVCLYELIREKRAGVGPVEKETAASSEQERITRLLFETLQAAGYVKPASARASEEKLRRLVRRLSLTPGDAELLLGMLRQIGWKLRSGKQSTRVEHP
jgi:tRNA/rRNA methyltransferase